MTTHRDRRLDTLQAQANDAARRYAKALQEADVALIDYKTAHNEAVAYQERLKRKIEVRAQQDARDLEIAQRFTAADKGTKS